MPDPYKVVREFESELCRYTGAPFAVTTNSCTMALTLAVAWHLREHNNSNRAGQMWDCDYPGFVERTPCIEIPRRTYISVGMAIIHAGGRPTFRDEEWAGVYQLKPLPVWDSARLFTCGLYDGTSTTFAGVFKAGSMVCCSFHASKTLGDTQGGCILHDNPEADAWLRRARFDGRTEGVAPKDDTFTQIGYHCYLSPDVAARLLLKLHSLPRHNEPLPNDEYPDLSKMDIFK